MSEPVGELTFIQPGGPDTYLARSEYTAADVKAKLESVVSATPAANASTKRDAAGVVRNPKVEVNNGLICAPKANIPECPDNVAGTTYIQDAWATVDGWGNHGSSSVLTVANRKLIVTGNLAQSYTRARRTVTAGSWANKTYRLKLTTLKGGSCWIGHTDTVPAVVQLQTVTLAAGQTFIFNTFVPANSDTVIHFGNNTYGDDVLTVEFIYAGNGNHDSLALDASGNGNHGTVYGCTPVAGITGRALRFNGESYVRAPTITTGQLFADAASRWSVSIWIGPSTSDAIGAFIGRAVVNSTDRVFLINEVSVGDKSIAVRIRGTQTTISTPIVSGFALITVTWDGTTARAYKDGVFVSNLSVGNRADDASVLVMGMTTALNANRLIGTIDDPRIYNRALSAEEIWELYQNPGGNCINDMEVSVTPTMNSIVARGPDGRIRLSTHTPATAGAAGTVGQIAYDASYIYICTATNTWKRVAIASW
jgi:hypothetical protein